MRGAHHAGAVGGECGERLRADLRGAAAEAAVGRLELVGKYQLRLCCGARRHAGLLAVRSSRDFDDLRLPRRAAF
jgi:hypothetical protein